MPNEDSDPLVTPRTREPRSRGRIAAVANWFVCTLRSLGGIPNDSPTQGDGVILDRHDTDRSIKQEAGISRQIILQILSKEKRDGNGIDSAAEQHELMSEFDNWIPFNEHNINKLIQIFGNRVVEQTDDYGRNLIHHTVSEGAFDCAKILFDYAAVERINVDLCCNDGDILKTELEKYSRQSVQFVLERMAMRCASARQTIEVLSRNLSELLMRFPDIFEKFLVNDKLCFALGKLYVPKSIFDGTDTKPIGFICDYDPRELKWKMHEESEVLQFLQNQCPRILEEIGGTEGEVITAVLKFVPLEDVVVSGRKMSIADITAAKCSVDVFKCEAIKCNVHWKWHNYLRSKFLFSNVMYLISVAFFFVFATYYGDIANDTEAWNVSDLTGDFGEMNQTLARVSLCLSFCFLVVPLIVRPSSYSWLFFRGLETEAYLLYHAFSYDHHTTLSVIVLSIQCLLILYKTLQYLRPVRRFGLFITMITYLLVEVVPFLVIGAIMLVYFGVAMFVMLGRSYQTACLAFYGPQESQNHTGTSHCSNSTDESLEEQMQQYRNHFGSVWRSLEFLLYSIVGNFDTEIFHLSTNSHLSGWITLYFSVYVLAAAIILLSLLISVLSNTFDRVTTHEEAEFVKCRAQRIAAFERITTWWKELWRGWRSRDTLASSSEQSKDATKYYYHNGHLKPVGDKLAVFHYLVPEEKAVVRDEDKTGWTGRINAVAKATQDFIEKGKDEATREREMLQDKIGTLSAEVKSLKDTLSAEVQHKIDTLSGEVQSLKDTHSGEVQSLKDMHSAEVQSLKDMHSAEVQSLKDTLSECAAMTVQTNIMVQRILHGLPSQQEQEFAQS